MSKILGLDYGKNITGISITDKNNIFAFGLDSVPTKILMFSLKKIFFKENISKIVVGLPLNLNNQLEKIENNIQKFLNIFSKKYPKIIIERIDERYTSKISYDLIKSIVKKKRIKKIINQMSATIILQSYLFKFKKNL